MGQTTGPFSMVCRVLLATCALAACAATLLLAAHYAVAATGSDMHQDATQAYEWSIDLDCTLCHAPQAASVLTQGGDSGNGGMAASAKAGAGAHTSSSTAGSETTSAAGVEGATSPSTGTSRAETEGAKPSAIDRYAAQHVENLGFTCITCHEDTEGLATGHKKLNSGKEATRLRKSKVEPDLCTTCHSAEALASATADSTAVTDGRGTSVNPHDLPKTDSHLGIGCTDCHVAHNGETHAAEAALATCTSCHHANVFACGTCH